MAKPRDLARPHQANRCRHGDEPMDRGALTWSATARIVLDIGGLRSSARGDLAPLAPKLAAYLRSKW